MLYGPPGFWNMVVQEQAAARKRKQEAIEEASRQRDRLFWGLSLTAGVLIFVSGVGFMIWGLDSLVNG